MPTGTKQQLHRGQVTFLKIPEAFRPMEPIRTGGPLELFCQEPRKGKGPNPVFSVGQAQTNPGHDNNL